MFVAQSNVNRPAASLEYNGKSQSATANSVWYDQQPRQKWVFTV